MYIKYMKYMKLYIYEYMKFYIYEYSFTLSLDSDIMKNH